MIPKKEKVKKENNLTVEETIKAIRHKFGEDSIVKLDQKPDVGVDAISTGSFGLDVIIGIGGFPRGRIVEVYGPESTGKTTLALHAIAEAQKTGGQCAYIDVEHAMDPQYAKNIGVNTSELFISQADSGEQALSMLEDLVRSNKFDVVVLDSVASLAPLDEIEGEMGNVPIGKMARLLSHGLRKLKGVIGESKTVVILINQIRQKIGVIYGSPEFTPGGLALKFYASVRIEVRVVGKIKKGEEIFGSRIRAKIVKNKVGIPFKQTEFDLIYNEGISQEGEILAMGEHTGILKKSGNSYLFGEEKIGRGYESARQSLKENPELMARVRQAVLDKMTDGTAVLASGDEGDINKEDE